MKPHTILASWAVWVLKLAWLSASWLVVFKCWGLVPCLQGAAPAPGQLSQLKDRGCAVFQSLRRAGRCRGTQGVLGTGPHCPLVSPLPCGAGAGSLILLSTSHRVTAGCANPTVQLPGVPRSLIAQVWGWASCLGSPQSPQQAEATAATAAGTQGGLIKLGCVATCCNHSLNDCKFGLVDLLNPCIFSVPVCCKSQTFSIFFIWFQKTVSVLKTSLWKMLVYPAVLFYLGWLHN